MTQFIQNISNHQILSINQHEQTQYDKFLYEMTDYNKPISSEIHRSLSISDSDESFHSKKIYSKQFSKNTSTVTSLQINPKLNMMKLNTIFIKNAKPIIVQSSHLRLMVSRYLNKLNSNIRYGSFRVDLKSGMVYLTLQSILSKRQMRSIIKNKNRYNLKEEIKLSQLYVQFNVRKIFYLIGEITEEINIELFDPNPGGKLLKFNENQQKQPNGNIKEIKKKMESIIPSNKINPQQQIQIFDLLVKISKVDRFEYGFMYNHVLKKIRFSNVQCKKRLKRSEELFNSLQIQSKSKNQKYIDIFLKICQFVGQKLEIELKNVSIQQYDQQWIDQFDRIFIRYLTQPLAKVSNPIDNTFLFCNILVLNINEISRDQIVEEGGFNILYRNKINFIYISNSRTDVTRQSTEQNQTLTKMIVIKSDKFGNVRENAKISHEKKILDQIKDMSCVNIVKCYHTQQSNLKQSLLMDFYSYKSFDYYLRYSYVSLISLMTKIYLLCQTIQGLRFLRDNNIVHLDMKPQNILIGKGLLLRLSDFGQSYHPDVCAKDFRPGYTIPYVAPQVFYDNPKYDEKFDVYSLGVLMHELFFSRTPISVKINSHEKLEQYYEKMEYETTRNQKLIVNPDDFNSYGIKKVMMILANVCLKCMRINQDERPYLDWILIQLRQCLNYLDKIY